MADHLAKEHCTDLPLHYFSCGETYLITLKLHLSKKPAKI